jgi:ABC-type sulfate transport system permease subunit
VFAPVRSGVQVLFARGSSGDVVHHFFVARELIPLMELQGGKKIWRRARSARRLACVPGVTLPNSVGGVRRCVVRCVRWRVRRVSVVSAHRWPTTLRCTRVPNEFHARRLSRCVAGCRVALVTLVVRSGGAPARRMRARGIGDIE